MYPAYGRRGCNRAISSVFSGNHVEIIATSDGIVLMK